MYFHYIFALDFYKMVHNSSKMHDRWFFEPQECFHILCSGITLIDVLPISRTLTSTESKVWQFAAVIGPNICVKGVYMRAFCVYKTFCPCCHIYYQWINLCWVYKHTEKTFFGQTLTTGRDAPTNSVSVNTSECLLSAQSVLLMTGVVHQDAAAPLWSASRLSGKSLCNHSYSTVARGDLFTS